MTRVERRRQTSLPTVACPWRNSLVYRRSSSPLLESVTVRESGQDWIKANGGNGRKGIFSIARRWCAELD